MSTATPKKGSKRTAAAAETVEESKAKIPSSVPALRALAMQHLGFNDEQWIALARKCHNEPDALASALRVQLVEKYDPEHAATLLAEARRGEIPEGYGYAPAERESAVAVSATREEAEQYVEDGEEIVERGGFPVDEMLHDLGIASGEPESGDDDDDPEAAEAEAEAETGEPVPGDEHEHELSAPTSTRKRGGKSFVETAAVGINVTAPRAALADAVALVKQAVSKRSTLPVLSTILVTREENGNLRLAATNLEYAIAVGFPVPAFFDAENSAATVPAALFDEFLRALPAQTGGSATMVTLATDANTNLVRAAAGKAKLNMKAYDPREFPTIPLDMYQGQPTIEMGAVPFKLGLSGSMFAMSKDDARPIFSALWLAMRAQHVEFVAADSYRLAYQRVQCEVPEEYINKVIMIPSAAIQVLARVLPDSGKVRLAIGPHGNQVIVSHQRDDGTTFAFFSNLISGIPANYEAIIPRSFTTQATVDRQQMRSALKTVSLLARESAQIMRMKIDPDQRTVTLTAVAEDVGDSEVVVDDAAIDSLGDAQIIVNAKFLLEAVDACDGQEVTLCLNADLQPMAVKAPNGEPLRVSGFLSVVMPMHSTKE